MVVVCLLQGGEGLVVVVGGGGEGDRVGDGVAEGEGVDYCAA